MQKRAKNDTVLSYTVENAQKTKGLFFMKAPAHISRKRRRTAPLVLCLLLFAALAGFLCGRTPRSILPGVVNTGNETVIQPEDAWQLTLVNAKNPIEGDPQIELTELRNGQAIDSRVYPALQRMMDDARAAGLRPLICSSYRTNEKQTELFQNKVASYLNQGYSVEEATRLAAGWVAAPGTSEHQLGLAVDIVAESYQLLDEQQEQTAEQQWLIENCAAYGFILRYPTDKSDVTGVGYEPWHYRYVGETAANEIMSQGVCLEEYLGATA